MKILILGGSGFLGVYLKNYLIKKKLKLLLVEEITKTIL